MRRGQIRAGRSHVMLRLATALAGVAPCEWSAACSLVS